MTFYAVIPAGGKGTRLWPLSRNDSPKFLHRLVDTSQSLLQATVSRLSTVTESPDQLYIATGVRHAAAVAEQVPEIPSAHVVVEPSPRDSAPAIALAAAIIAQRDPDAIMGCFASDHYVEDEESFSRAIRDAIDIASAGYLVTIGIEPRHPETGYGYIHRADPLEGSHGKPIGFRVAEFTEKPAYKVAQSYVASGEYFWNAGMFVWRTDSLLNELARQEPDFHAGIMRIAAAWEDPSREEVLEEVWTTLPKTSIDYAVMEGAAAQGRVATVPASFGWNDVGDWDTLGAIVDGQKPQKVPGVTLVGEAAEGSAVFAEDTDGCVIHPAHGRAVALLGVKDLIVVDTPDALLISDRSRAQDVKRFADRLAEDS